MKKSPILLCLILSAAAATAQDSGTFTNPVIRGDVADPSVIRIGKTYYAAGTSSEWAPFYPMFKSVDLVNWKPAGHIFDRQPEWTSNSFWAPELFYHNGTVYCYYTARQKSTGISYIGVATADSPEGEFTDHGPIIEYGTESIDAFAFEDNGRLYISWKAYGLDRRPIEILCSRLSDDGLRLEGEPFMVLRDDDKIGMEGQDHFKHGDYYYIVYAARGCCGPRSDYEVCVARSERLEGPYEKYNGNPILYGGGGDFLSCGHGTIVTAPDDRMFYLCHAYLKDEGFFAGRQPVLHEMEMTDDGWVRFKTGRVATATQPVPFKGTVQKISPVFKDKFNGSRLNAGWSWNYPYSDIDAQVSGGSLFLSGKPKDGNRYGTALCIRPQSPHYICETEVVNDNGSMKGLTVYGDSRNLVIWGMEGRELVLKGIVKDAEHTLFRMPCDGNVFLRMEVDSGHSFRFWWSKDGKDWKEAGSDGLDGSALARWDRVQRPGLIHCGRPEEPARFSYFMIENI